MSDIKNPSAGKTILIHDAFHFLKPVELEDYAKCPFSTFDSKESRRVLASPDGKYLDPLYEWRVIPQTKKIAEKGDYVFYRNANGDDLLLVFHSRDEHWMYVESVYSSQEKLKFSLNSQEPLYAAKVVKLPRELSPFEQNLIKASCFLTLANLFMVDLESAQNFVKNNATFSDLMIDLYSLRFEDSDSIEHYLDQFSIEGLVQCFEYFLSKPESLKIQYMGQLHKEESMEALIYQMGLDRKRDREFAAESSSKKPVHAVTRSTKDSIVTQFYEDSSSFAGEMSPSSLPYPLDSSWYSDIRHHALILIKERRLFPDEELIDLAVQQLAYNIVHGFDEEGVLVAH